jgi:hypothetical protein
MGAREIPLGARRGGCHPCAIVTIATSALEPPMTRVLIIANRTATSDALLATLRRRASEGGVQFHLVVPAEPQGLHRVVDPEVAGRDRAQERLRVALPLLAEATGAPVEGSVGDADPIAAISDALALRGFDEIIVSTLPRRLSRWLRLDLPSKARGFGLPVVHVELAEAPALAA